MPLTDNFMLPRRVRTMEQMADLLQAEETELAQAQRVIDAMFNQLAVGTSTFLLPRHERIFGLPVNTEESMESRRARVMARLNTRGVTTVQTILEMVRLITGREGDVAEHFADYSFSVAVHLLFQDSTKDLRELIRQIDEVKPAHLLYDTTAAIQPVTLENKNRLLFVNQLIRLRLSNPGKGVALSRFMWKCLGINRQALASALLLRGHTRNSFSGGAGAIYRSSGSNRQQTRQGIKVSAGAINAQSTGSAVTVWKVHRLNGKFLLNGAKKLDAGTTREEL